jgi:hypothetical protein
VTELPSSFAGGGWDNRFTVAGFSGIDGLGPTVRQLVGDGDGNLFAVGYFQWLGREKAPGIARRDAAGAWHAWASSFPTTPPAGGFSAMAVQGQRIALATYPDFMATNREIWVDDGNGLTVVGHVQGPVRRMAWFNGQLWIVGTFSATADVPSSQIAVWNGTSWASPPGGGVGDQDFAYELLVDGPTLYVGGHISTIGGVATKNVAAFDGTQWTPYDLPDVTVYALSLDAAGALVAGGFEAQAYGGAYRREGASWQPLGSGVGLGDPSLSGVVSSMAAYGGELYATGCFSALEGSGERVAGLARFDGNAWVPVAGALAGEQPLSPWLSFGVCGNDGQLSIYDVDHQFLTVHAGRLFLAGLFGGVGGAVSSGVASFDGNTWGHEGAENGAGISGYISGVSADASTCSVHAIGDMTHAGGQPVHSGLLRSTAEGWIEEGGPRPEGRSCDRVAAGNGKIFAACTRQADGVAEIYSVSDSSWTLLEALPPSYFVKRIKLDPTQRLWVVGSAVGSSSGGPDGALIGFVRRYQNGDVTIVAENFDAAVNDIAFAPATSEPVVGGGFSHAGSTALGHVARWTAGGWQPVGGSLPDEVTALAFDGTSLIAAMFINQGQSAPGIRESIDGGPWQDTSGDLSAIVGEVRELAAHSGTLIAVGALAVPLSPGQVALEDRGVYVRTDGHWRSLAGGVGSQWVSSVAILDHDLWLAGQGIATAGSPPISSVGAARFTW